MVRKYPFQEEIKILMAEVFRDGDLTDAEWTYKYEQLKLHTPLEEMGSLMLYMTDLGYHIEHAKGIIKDMLFKAKRKEDLKRV